MVAVAYFAFHAVPPQLLPHASHGAGHPGEVSAAGPGERRRPTSRRDPVRGTAEDDDPVERRPRTSVCGGAGLGVVLSRLRDLERRARAVVLGPARGPWILAAWPLPAQDTRPRRRARSSGVRSIVATSGQWRACGSMPRPGSPKPLLIGRAEDVVEHPPALGPRPSAGRRRAGRALAGWPVDPAAVELRRSDPLGIDEAARPRCSRPAMARGPEPAEAEVAA